ncbi:MAG: electron transfer flavoprotein subunit alpha/FixB family protein [Candidatus Dormibacteria bacterium]
MALEKVWVFAEVVDGKASSGALELLTKARQLGTSVTAIVLAPDGEGAVAQLGEYGASTVYLGTDSAYTELLLGGPAADAIAVLAQEHQPDAVLFGSTYNGRDIAGRLAAKLDAPVISNGLELSADGELRVHTAIFGASELLTTQFDPAARPAIALLRPKSLLAEPGGGATPTVVPIDAPVAEVHRSARVTARTTEQSKGPKLEDAPVVISGGRGLGDPANFELLEQLAQLVHGAVGASRAVVDAGWVPYSMQVGQTGKTVKPTVYIACGISGAMQHTVGMKGAKNILAINRDADAPIFKLADLGVVGDAVKILPQVIEQLKNRA